MIVLFVALNLDKPWVADRYAAVARQGSALDLEANYHRAISWHDVYVYRLDLSYIAYERFKESGQRSDLETATTVINSAIKSHPDEPALYILLAESYFTAAKLGLVPESTPIAPLNDALTLYPQMPAAHYLLGKILIEEERYSEAIDALQYVASVAPEWSQAQEALRTARSRNMGSDPQL